MSLIFHPLIRKQQSSEIQLKSSLFNDNTSKIKVSNFDANDEMKNSPLDKNEDTRIEQNSTLFQNQLGVHSLSLTNNSSLINSSRMHLYVNSNRNDESITSGIGVEMIASSRFNEGLEFRIPSRGDYLSSIAQTDNNLRQQPLRKLSYMWRYKFFNLLGIIGKLMRYTRLRIIQFRPDLYLSSFHFAIINDQAYNVKTDDTKNYFKNIINRDKVQMLSEKKIKIKGCQKAIRSQVRSNITLIILAYYKYFMKGYDQEIRRDRVGNIKRSIGRSIG